MNIKRVSIFLLVVSIGMCLESKATFGDKSAADHSSDSGRGQVIRFMSSMQLPGILDVYQEERAIGSYHSLPHEKLRESSATKACGIDAYLYELLTHSSYPKIILPYDAQRDREFIRTLFIRDWHWLTIFGPESYDPAYYDIEYLLDSGIYASYGNDPLEVIIKMALDKNGTPQGFIVYLVDDEKTGRILFLSVAESSRRTGVASGLMKHAMNHLKELGMETVFLLVHRDNYGAMNLYKKLGFVEDVPFDIAIKFIASLGEPRPVSL